MKRINIKKWVAVLLTLATVTAAAVQIGCGGNKPQESSPETTPSPTPMESTPATPSATPNATPDSSDSTPSASVTAPPWYSSGASTESGGDPFQGEWDPIN